MVHERPRGQPPPGTRAPSGGAGTSGFGTGAGGAGGYPGRMSDVRSIYVTAGNEAQAHELADALLERRLVACANLLPGMRALYRWEGKTVEDQEVVLILKSSADRIDDALAAIDALHPYEVPCAVVWPVEAGLPAYLDWVRGETRPSPSD